MPTPGQADAKRLRAEVQAEFKKKILEGKKAQKPTEPPREVMDMAKANTLRPGITRVSNPTGAIRVQAPLAAPSRPALRRPPRRRRSRRRSSAPASAWPSPPQDPGLPRLASQEVDDAALALFNAGYVDDRVADPQRITKRQLLVGLKPDKLFWTAPGMAGMKPAAVSNVKFIPGARGQGVQMKDSVVMSDAEVGKFERTQPFTLDVWVKLRGDKPYDADTRPEGPDASILYNTTGVNGAGYELSLHNGKLQYQLTHSAPANQIKVVTKNELPKGKWVHLTATYDGNSKAEGVRLYVDGQPAQHEVIANSLTRSIRTRAFHSFFGSYYGLASGMNFNRPELVDGAIDELRVVTRALTPIEVAYLHNPKIAANYKPEIARVNLTEILAQKDPAVVKAWQELTAAREAEQKVESPIYKLLVAGDAPYPRKNYVLDRGVYNAYMQEVQAQALPRVFAWDEKLPRDRLGLAQWLFDPKHPLTSRVFVNRMWQSHFGTGIVADGRGLRHPGLQPDPPGTARLARHRVRPLGLGHEAHAQADGDVGDLSPGLHHHPGAAREGSAQLPPGARARATACRPRVIRDNALFASGLLVDKPGGDSRLPVPAGRHLGRRGAGLRGLSVRRAERPDAPALDVHLRQAQRAAGQPVGVRHARPEPVDASRARSPTRRCRRWCC